VATPEELVKTTGEELNVPLAPLPGCGKGHLKACRGRDVSEGVKWVACIAWETPW